MSFQVRNKNGEVFKDLLKALQENKISIYEDILRKKFPSSPISHDLPTPEEYYDIFPTDNPQNPSLIPRDYVFTYSKEGYYGCKNYQDDQDDDSLRRSDLLWLVRLRRLVKALMLNKEVHCMLLFYYYMSLVWSQEEFVILMSNALCLAVEKWNIPGAQVVLSYGASPRYLNDLPMNMASKEFHKRMIVLLLEYGGNVHVNDDLPLYKSISKLDYELTDTFLRLGADLSMNGIEWIMRKPTVENVIVGKDGSHMLMTLLKHGFNLVINRNVLYEMTYKSNPTTIRNMLACGYDLHQDGEYLFRHLILNKNIDAVRVLLENGFDANVHDGIPLYNAIHSKLPAMVELLLQYGADPDIRGYEFIETAENMSLVEILGLLISKSKLPGIQ